MTAKRVRDGKITANFYTDGWPVFSTVVCQLLKPRLSDVGHVEAYWYTAMVIINQLICVIPSIIM